MGPSAAFVLRGYSEFILTVAGIDEDKAFMAMQWFVLRVASNKEEQVRETLARKMQVEGVASVGRILVPTEQVKRIRAGKQRVHKRKLYPGYVFMEMELQDGGRVPEQAWYIIKDTMGAGDFISTEGVPTAMRDTEVAKMLKEAEKPEDTPNIKMEFEKGDLVKIREGAFENFEGVVDVIDTERGVVRVIVTIFGRSTPLDIEYWQIEKV
jgi:transcriptional antiterminator NusG